MAEALCRVLSLHSASAALFRGFSAREGHQSQGVQQGQGDALWTTLWAGPAAQGLS